MSYIQIHSITHQWKFVLKIEIVLDVLIDELLSIGVFPSCFGQMEIYKTNVLLDSERTSTPNRKKQKKKTHSRPLHQIRSGSILDAMPATTLGSTFHHLHRRPTPPPSHTPVTVLLLVVQILVLVMSKETRNFDK